MANGDIRVCPACRTIFIEDDQMYLDPNRCPKCGADLTAYEAKGESEDG